MSERSPDSQQKIRVGILTASDRAKSGEYEDRSGPAIVELLHRYLASSWEPVYRLVEDKQETIEITLRELVDHEQCCLVITTGGTGPAPRDVTPEATEEVCERMLPGFGEQMRRASLESVPTAILSRQTAGTRGRCLILNLPGKPAAIEECLEAVFPAVPYCIELVGGPLLECNEDHVNAFRPKGS